MGTRPVTTVTSRRSCWSTPRDSSFHLSFVAFTAGLVPRGKPPSAANPGWTFTKIRAWRVVGSKRKKEDPREHQ